MGKVLNAVRESLNKLPRGHSVVGFFGRDNEKYVPLSELHAVAVYRGDEREYNGKTQRSTVVLGVPAFQHNGQILMGGSGWFSYQEKGQTRYTREPRDLPKFWPGDKGDYPNYLISRAVGQFYDLQLTDPRLRVCLPDTEGILVSRLAKMAQHFDCQPLTAREVLPPRFIQPLRQGQVALRRCKALREKVEMCIRTDVWNIYDIVGFAAPARGSIKVIDRSKLEFTCEEDGSTEILSNPQELCEDWIEKTFGVDVRVDLYPRWVDGSVVQVKSAQSLFTPILDAKLQVDKQPDACDYLAAGTTLLIYGEYLAMDHALVSGPEEPMAALDEAVSLQVVRGNPCSLWVKGENYHLDFFDVSKRTQYRVSKQLRERLKSEGKKAPDWAIEKPWKKELPRALQLAAPLDDKDVTPARIEAALGLKPVMPTEEPVVKAAATVRVAPSRRTFRKKQKASAGKLTRRLHSGAIAAATKKKKKKGKK